MMKEFDALSWIVSVYDYLKLNGDIIHQHGFKKAGILDAIEGNLDDLNTESVVDDDAFSDLYCYINC